MRNAFALIHTFPELKNAEYEVLQRILGAAKNVSVDVVVVDDSGRVIWAPDSMLLSPGDDLSVDMVDFTISLHFLSAKLFDSYSYYAIWQPLQFYYDFGYQESIEKFASHNDLLSCASDRADAHALNIFEGLGRTPRLPLPELFHSLPEPFLSPEISEESRLFYIGINWQRLGRPKGRFHDTLTMLDTKGLTDIYGPEKVHGVAPWDGFETYRGELPFDGISVKEAIHRAGICLALSSASHSETGIMSNRLFEGFGGGAAVIATPNALIDKFFLDAVYLVDDTRGEEILGQQIIEAVRQIRANPQEAVRRTLLGQQIVRERCSLEHSIASLMQGHAQRKRYFEDQCLAPAEISVVLYHEDGDYPTLRGVASSLARQVGCTIHLHILCDKRFAARYEAQCAALPGAALKSATLHPAPFLATLTAFDGIPSSTVRAGKLVRNILSQLHTPYFALLKGNERLFEHHYGRLVRTLEDQGSETLASCSGMISEETSPSGGVRRKLTELRLSNDLDLLLVTGAHNPGRFLYRRSMLDALPENLLQLLDGQEARYFALEALLTAPIAQSGYATLLSVLTSPVRRAMMPDEQQQQYVRDRFATDPRWIHRVNRNRALPEFIYAEAPGTPIRWHNHQRKDDLASPIDINRAYAVTRSGDFEKFATAGFSHPEEDHVWVSGDRAILDFALPEAAQSAIEDYEIVCHMNGRRSQETGREQHCTVLINGLAVGYYPVSEVFTSLRFPIPPRMMQKQSTIRVELIPDHAEPVTDRLGNVIDNRNLSIGLKNFGLFERPYRRLPVMQANDMQSCGMLNLGAEALVDGFYASEPDFTWICGRKATIRFRMADQPTQPRLVLDVIARASHDEGAHQKLDVLLNGEARASFELGNGRHQVGFEINPELLTSSSVHITLRLRHAEPVINEDGEIGDARLLGLAVAGFGIVDLAQSDDEGGRDS